MCIPASSIVYYSYPPVAPEQMSDKLNLESSDEFYIVAALGVQHHISYVIYAVVSCGRMPSIDSNRLR